MPQPNLVPVRPRWSRSTQSKGVSSGASTFIDLPLICNVVIELLHWVATQCRLRGLGGSAAYSWRVCQSPGATCCWIGTRDRPCPRGESAADGGQRTFIEPIRLRTTRLPPSARTCRSWCVHVGVVDAARIVSSATARARSQRWRRQRRAERCAPSPPSPPGIRPFPPRPLRRARRRAVVDDAIPRAVLGKPNERREVRREHIDRRLVALAMHPEEAQQAIRTRDGSVVGAHGRSV